MFYPTLVATLTWRSMKQSTASSPENLTSSKSSISTSKGANSTRFVTRLIHSQLILRAASHTSCTSASICTTMMLEKPVVLVALWSVSMSLFESMRLLPSSSSSSRRLVPHPTMGMSKVVDVTLPPDSRYLRQNINFIQQKFPLLRFSKERLSHLLSDIEHINFLNIYLYEPRKR